MGLGGNAGGGYGGSGGVSGGDAGIPGGHSTGNYSGADASADVSLFFTGEPIPVNAANTKTNKTVANGLSTFSRGIEKVMSKALPSMVGSALGGIIGSWGLGKVFKGGGQLTRSDMAQMEQVMDRGGGLSNPDIMYYKENDDGSITIMPNPVDNSGQVLSARSLGEYNQTYPQKVSGEEKFSMLNGSAGWNMVKVNDLLDTSTDAKAKASVDQNNNTSTGTTSDAATGVPQHVDSVPQQILRRNYNRVKATNPGLLPEALDEQIQSDLSFSE